MVVVLFTWGAEHLPTVVVGVSQCPEPGIGLPAVLGEAGRIYKEESDRAMTIEIGDGAIVNYDPQADENTSHYTGYVKLEGVGYQSWARQI